MPPKEFKPDPRLSHLVQHYWIAQREFSEHNRDFLIYPDSKVELIFNFGAPLYEPIDGRRYYLAPCFVVGLLDSTVQVQAEGDVSLVCARLYPWAYAPLLYDLLSGSAIGIRYTGDLLQVQADAIKRKLIDSETSAVAELEQFLLDRLSQSSFEQPDIIAAAHQILDQKGNVIISELSLRNFLSPRSLRRKFQKLFGLSPKVLARTARFELVRDTLWLQPNSDLAEVALVAGYSDQAHMHREFRHFASCTPQQFALRARDAQSR